MSPDAGSVGVLCNSYGAHGFATVFCAHVADGSEESFHAAALIAASSAAAVIEESPPREDKRALLDAAQTTRKLPLHFALLASSHTDLVDTTHPHPDVKPAVEVAQQSLWPLTLLEASHAASMQFHGQTSSLRDSAVMAAATAAEAGKARKLGKSLNSQRRRAAIVPLLSSFQPGNPLMLPAPISSGAPPVLVASQNALLNVAHAVVPHVGGLLHLRLPANAVGPYAAVDDDEQSPHIMDATVAAPGAGAFHCAAFRAAWATCFAWGVKLPCDPSCEVFCPAEHAAGSIGAKEPRLDLPPLPADADSAALEVRSRFCNLAKAKLSQAPMRRSFHVVRTPRGLADPPASAWLFPGQQPQPPALGLCQMALSYRLLLVTALVRCSQLLEVVHQLRNQQRSASGEMASSLVVHGCPGLRRHQQGDCSELLAGRLRRAAWTRIVSCAHIRHGCILSSRVRLAVKPFFVLCLPITRQQKSDRTNEKSGTP